MKDSSVCSPTGTEGECTLPNTLAPAEALWCTDTGLSCGLAANADGQQVSDWVSGKLGAVLSGVEPSGPEFDLCACGFTK